MNPALTDVWQQMKELGLGALSHANRHAAYSTLDNPKWPELSVLQVAHAAELLIKARIAQEHPLLIFAQVPRSSQIKGSFIEIEDLFRHGRTIQWSDLPERLWAVTGMQVPNLEDYNNFGKIRNGIQHFKPLPTAGELWKATLQFIFEVIDSFINECWGLYVIDYDEDHESYVYFVNALFSNEILFLFSIEAAKCHHEWDVDWDAVSDSYKNELLMRINKALDDKEL